MTGRRQQSKEVITWAALGSKRQARFRTSGRGCWCAGCLWDRYVILLFLALFGAALGCRKGLVRWKHVGALFVFTSLLGTTLGAMVAQLIPNEIQLLLFATLIISVAIYMWSRLPSAAQAAAKGGSAADSKIPTGSKEKAAPVAEKSSPDPFSSAYFVAIATSVGCLCGSLGVGGGFILTPLLCHMGHEMETAVPTSLAVIFLSSCVGASWYVHLFDMSLASVDLTVATCLVLVGCFGISVSGQLASMMPSSSRQKVYAGMLFALGCGTFVTEGAKHFW